MKQLVIGMVFLHIVSTGKNKKTAFGFVHYSRPKSFSSPCEKTINYDSRSAFWNRQNPSHKYSWRCHERMLTQLQEKEKSMSVGESIQSSNNVHELLIVASNLWLPSDENLLPHLRTQAIHHEKRQRWASQLIFKLGTMSPVSFIKEESNDNSLWEHNGLVRAVQAAALSFTDATYQNEEGLSNKLNYQVDAKEAKLICSTLLGLHAIAGKTLKETNPTCHNKILESVHLLLEKVDQVAPTLSLREAAEVRWASRGIIIRLYPQFIVSSDVDMKSVSRKDLELLLNNALPKLEKKTSPLPFDIIPLVVDWEKIPSSQKAIDELKDAIPFQFDTITTRTGESVKERRGTAWLAENGIGALAYSGKLMPPNPLSPIVQDVMRDIENVVLDDDITSLTQFDNYFDCALCNFYPDEESACKFHTDPEHGSFWERLTCVVAAGEERRFAFRPIPGIATWNYNEQVFIKNEQKEKQNTPNIQSNKRKGSKKKTKNNGPIGSNGHDQESNSPAVVHLFQGDVVKMWGRCNDDFHHAVYTAEYDFDINSPREGRVSLVLKRAMDRGKGRKGHGIHGEGRRRKRVKANYNS